MTSEAKAASTSSTPPNEQDVQFLSDGYDDLVKSAKGMSEEFKKKKKQEDWMHLSFVSATSLR